MSESWIIEIAGLTAGIIVREPGERRFEFHASENRFARFNGQRFAGPREAERVLALQPRRTSRRPAQAFA